MKLYPLFFFSRYVRKVWGGKKLASLYHRNLPAENIGESWEISDRPEASSTVKNGPLQNKKLSELMQIYGKRITGSRITAAKPSESFPLLFKILTPKDRLSVQVHPGEKFAETCQHASSKKEMWYVLEAEPGAKIIYGLKDRNISAEKVIKKAEQGQLENLLHRRPISRGEAIFIAPGMVHALLGGAVIAEIQQNSDTTYRLYDWNRENSSREKRPLHLKKALKTIKPDLNPYHSYFYPEFYTKNMWRLLSLCRSFTSYELKVKKKEVLSPRELDSFIILFCQSGKLNLNYQQNHYQLTRGNCCLLPADLTRVEITGRADILLFHRGYSGEEFRNLIKEKELPAEKINRIPGAEHEYL